MRKHAALIILSLLIGAVMNVGVAWWFAASATPSASRDHYLLTPAWTFVRYFEEDYRKIKVAETWPGGFGQIDAGHVVITTTGNPNYGYTEYILYAACDMPSNDAVLLPEESGKFVDGISDFAAYVDARAGWPFESLHWRGHGRLGTWMYKISMRSGNTEFELLSIDKEIDTGNDPMTLTRNPIRLGSRTLHLDQLPAIPLPSGFALNTLVYSSPLILSVLIRPAWRWRKRRLLARNP